MRAWKYILFHSKSIFEGVNDIWYYEGADIVCQLISLPLQKLSFERPSSDGEGAVENGITTVCNGKEQGMSGVSNVCWEKGEYLTFIFPKKVKFLNGFFKIQLNLKAELCQKRFLQFWQQHLMLLGR